MKPFTKTEFKATVLIFLCIFAITFINLRVALRRSRDAQRRADLGAITDALNAFHENYGFFPPSENGAIKWCKGGNYSEVLDDISDDSFFDKTKYFSGLVACKWGQNAFEDLIKNEKGYLTTIPGDPRSEIGSQYLYLSDTEYFQIYTYLEGESSEDTYNYAIVGRGLNCGSKICSFGKSYVDIPLDKSIDEYRIELEVKKKFQK